MTVAMQRRGALNSVRLPEMWTFGKILVIFLMFGTGDCADLKSTAAASATSVLRHRHFGKYFALTIFFLVLGIVAAFVIYDACERNAKDRKQRTKELAATRALLEKGAQARNSERRLTRRRRRTQQFSHTSRIKAPRHSGSDEDDH